MSNTGIMPHQGGLSLDRLDRPSPIIPEKNEHSASSIEDAGSVSRSRLINDDSISFLGLPYQIWKKIFRYAGVICTCHIALVPVRRGNLRSSGGADRRHPLRNHTTGSTSFVTCAFRKIPEYSCRNHMIHLSMLEASRMTRFITLKALLQEGFFHFELMDTEDVDALDQTLRGFDFMPPLNRELKSLHLNLFFAAGQQKSEYLGGWYYFCDYFSKHLKGSLLRFGLESRPGSVENAEEITASKATSKLRGLIICNVLFDSGSPRQSRGMSRRYAQLSAQFVREVTFERTGTFRFMEVPIEIQMMILQYVLVTDQVIFRGERSWVCSVPTQRHGDGKYRHSHSCCMCSFLKHRETLTGNTACSWLRKCSVTVRHLNPEYRVEVSPVPVFQTNKHIHTLGSSIFYAQNEFKFDTNELFSLSNSQRPYVSLGFPKRHTGLVRHLHIRLAARHLRYHTDADMKEYERLAELLKETFKSTLIDLTVDYMSWGLPFSFERRKKLLSLFDHFKGERPILSCLGPYWLY